MCCAIIIKSYLLTFNQFYISMNEVYCLLDVKYINWKRKKKNCLAIYLPILL